MQTDEIRIVLRRRSGLEAVDLGFAMVRRWWRPLALSWCLLVVPIALVLIAVLRDHPWWTIGLLWWLRPAFARVPLHVLSRALFGGSAGFLDTAAALPALLRSGLPTSLLIQRLSPARTFLQPVLQLEGLRGRSRRERCALLARQDMGAATGLSTAAAHMNAAILMGLLALLYLLIPEQAAWDVPDLLTAAGEHPVGRFVFPLLYLAGVSAVEPLLVAGGFSLYLNRRVFVECWDIDLAFRRLARRVKASPRGAAAGLAALLLLSAASSRAAGPGDCIPEDLRSAGDCVQAVLAADDFGHTDEMTRWKLRDGLFDWDPGEQRPAPPWLTGLGQLLATLAEGVLWSLVALGGIALLATLARRGATGATQAAAPSQAPASLFGLELDPHALPEDPVAEARVIWGRGARSDALSLLYRGALVALTRRSGLEIPGSATELECVRLVAGSQAPEPADLFRRLTLAWVGARYAGAPPEEEIFDALCLGFQQNFGVPA